MNKKEYKKQIIAACHQALETSMQTTHGTMHQRITDATESDEEGWSDMYESKDEEMIEDSRQLEPHLDFLSRALVTLEGLNPEFLHKEVGQGAVVITDSLRFLIASSAQKFKVDGKDFYGISIAAPIYAVMEGKKTGDSFSFNGKKYKIEDIF